MELQNRLVVLRKERGLSQEELAEKLYVSRQTISNWERGKTYPDLNSLILLATYFDVTLDNLVKGDMANMKHTIAISKSVYKKWLILSILGLFLLSLIWPTRYLIDSQRMWLWRLGFAILSFVVLTAFNQLYRLTIDAKLSSFTAIVNFLDGQTERPTKWWIEFSALIFLWVICFIGTVISTILFW